MNCKNDGKADGGRAFAIDISGAWRWETDENDVGRERGFYKRTLKNEGFMLPGSTCENGIGKKRPSGEALSKQTVRAPRERYEYIGVLWLEREIAIPEDARGKRLSLFLERVNISSELWLDGERVGRETIELSAPHIYALPRGTDPGSHKLTLRIDNRNLLNFGDMASGYSVDTQGIWCGVAGRAEITVEDEIHVENIQVYAPSGDINVTMTVASGAAFPSDRVPVTIAISVADPSGRVVYSDASERIMYNSRQPESFSFTLDDYTEWDEFTPALYTLRVECGGVEKSLKFGIRRIERRGKTMTLNGRPLSLRGTIDCAQFPLTGYPPTDKDEWTRRFKIYKSYGLNHVRFHAWCPPEAAFAAADEVGIYLSIEMPLWINRDVTPLEYGDDMIHDMYYPREARVISKTYGSHPSFVLFSNGNETMGNFELLSDITRMMRAYDPRRLYTLTSNFDHPILDCEDYICSQRVCGRDVRIQSLHDTIAKDTFYDYSDAVDASPVPIVSFEVGQYCSFPALDVCERYTGCMMPVNFEAIRDHMKRRGLYGRLDDYVAASGDLAVRLYREDIETALRTHGFGGFQLLSLCDYTGQSTATVGILDVFHESKGFITPEAFRSFCSETVPLIKCRRIFRASETLTTQFDLYDFGKEPIADPEFVFTVRDGDRVVFEVKTKSREVSLPLDGIASPTALTLTLAAGGHENSRAVYVFPDGGEDDADAPEIAADAESLRRVIARGGRAIVTAGAVKSPTRGSYIPVFWSPAHFPTSRPSGYIIDDAHGALSGFPTGKYPDYQWKTLLDNSKNADLTALGEISPIIEVVPNFVDCTRRSPLFEARVGDAALLFCGFDLDGGDPETRCLRNSLYRYVSDGGFEPAASVTEEALLSAFGIEE